MDLKHHIKILYWFCLVCGMLSFIYDTRSQRLVSSHRLNLTSRILYSIIALVSGYLAVLFTLRGILRLLGISQDFEESSFLAQDQVIEYLELTMKYVVIFVNVISFLKRKRRIRRAIKELLAIFDLVRHKTGNRLFINPSIRGLFCIKLLLGVYHIVRYTLKGFFYLIEVHDMSALLGDYLWQAGSWSLMYAHLVLICFYIKLDRYLTRYAHSFQSPENDIRLQEVIRISFQIHHVKKGIDVIYSPFLVLMYYGLLNDITNLFGILKEVLYKDFIVGRPDPLLQRVFSVLRALPDGVSATFEMYMIGCISTTLQNAEGLLQDRIITFSMSDNTFERLDLRRDIEIQLVYNKVHELSIWAYRIFKIDKGFAFNYLMSVVVMYVIICLQYFAREGVYSSSAANRRLIANYTKFSKKVEYNM